MAARLERTRPAPRPGSRRPRAAARAVLAALLVPALVGCPSSPYPEVHVDLASAPATPAASPAPNERALRFSVAAIQSPQGTFSAYSGLFERLAAVLGVEIELVQRRTYQEVNELLASGQLDAALVCTGGYVDLERRSPGAVELVAVPVVRGRTTYHSYLIVPAASPVTSLQDLRGKRFAFTDELSLSGFGYPSHLLRSMGAEARTFFASTVFTRSHDRSIEAVATGLVDGAAVDSLVYDATVRGSPEARAATRVIGRSPPYGIAPVVVSTRLSPERRAAIRDALLHLGEDDPAAREALRSIGFDRFVAPGPELYRDASALLDVRR